MDLGRWLTWLTIPGIPDNSRRSAAVEMGAGNVMRVSLRWGVLDGTAHKILVRMALVILDKDPEPRWFGGLEPLAEAIGRTDRPADPEAAWRYDKQTAKALDRGLAALRAAGILRTVVRPTTGRRAEYLVSWDGAFRDEIRSGDDEISGSGVLDDQRNPSSEPDEPYPHEGGTGPVDNQAPDPEAYPHEGGPAYPHDGGTGPEAYPHEGGSAHPHEGGTKEDWRRTTNQEYEKTTSPEVTTSPGPPPRCDKPPKEIPPDVTPPSATSPVDENQEDPPAVVHPPQTFPGPPTPPTQLQLPLHRPRPGTLGVTDHGCIRGWLPGPDGGRSTERCDRCPPRGGDAGVRSA